MTRQVQVSNKFYFAFAFSSFFRICDASSVAKFFQHWPRYKLIIVLCKDFEMARRVRLAIFAFVSSVLGVGSRQPST